MAGPLKDIRVLDLSRILAGPWAAQTLADLGAEVIKVERPEVGDDTRGWGPPYLRGRNDEPTCETAYYLCSNRGKRSITADLSHPQGQAIVRELALRSDILVENYKVGGLARYRLSYDDLKQINPRLIYCSVTGFGQTGPYRHRPGYDFMIQATGGLMSVTGERDGLPGGGPQKVGVPISDLFTGMYATIAILAALAHRDRTGEGQHIDMALLDSQAAMLSIQAMNCFVQGKAPVRMGNAHPNVVPYQVFATADGSIVVAVGNDGQFRRFCAAIARPDLAMDPRFATNGDRNLHREVLIPKIEAAMRTRSSSEWLAALDQAGVPCGPVNDIPAVFEDPQIRHRGMKIDLPHSGAGSAPQVASPMRFSASPIEYTRAAPLLGEHTDEVLAELLGKGREEIAALRDAGVI